MFSRANEYAYLCELVKTNSAIALDPQRTYLIDARLSPIAEQEGLTSVSDLVARLRARASSDLHWKVVEAMTTNETSFFRDVKPFDALRKMIVPQILQERPSRTLTIWCPACSSGQEPYSICMLLREHFPVLQSWKVQVVASDISTLMLEKAQQGLYSQMEVNRGLPATLLVKYFKKECTNWRLNGDIREMVDFRRVNLAEPWPFMPTADIVLLRNVMIYFNVEKKKQILKAMRQVLHPQGYLFLGTAETTINLDPNYQNHIHETVCYYRPLTRQ